MFERHPELVELEVGWQQLLVHGAQFTPRVTGGLGSCAAVPTAEHSLCSRGVQSECTCGVLPPADSLVEEEGGFLGQGKALKGLCLLSAELQLPCNQLTGQLPHQWGHSKVGSTTSREDSTHDTVASKDIASRRKWPPMLPLVCTPAWPHCHSPLPRVPLPTMHSPLHHRH